MEGAVEQRGKSEGRSMARGRTPYMPALLVAAVLVACVAAVATFLALSEKAESTFQGKTAG
jgi:hypothetical protein